jgi:hypothetical protein
MEKDLEDLKARIKNCFEKQDDQAQVIIELYRMVFPDWNRIKEIKGHPETGDELWEFICRLFQELDRLHHPDCLAGGAWMNWGFSVNPKLAPWEINSKNCTLTYQP